MDIELNQHQAGHQATNSHPYQMLQTGDPSSHLHQHESPPSSSTSSCTYAEFIHAGHYQILMNGDIGALRAAHARGDLNICDVATEFDKSSVLHVAAMANQCNLIEFIVSGSHVNDDDRLARYGLLLRPNSRGDLPIHVAARTCKESAVTKLIQCAPQADLRKMLKTENNDGDTALHIALENRQKSMAQVLFRECPETFYRLNARQRSPLYLAIKAGFFELVDRMLETDVEHQEDVLDHLDKGKVVHAAIMAKKLDILKTMLQKWDELKRCPDELHRRPLSYAAYTGFLDGVHHFVTDEECKNLEFRPDDDEDGSFPIHRACSGGNVMVVVKLLTHSPNTKWLLNKKGQNILHVAAGSGKANVVDYILTLEGAESFINVKDKDGNTPLHLASKGAHPGAVYALTWDNRVDLELQNNQGLTALDIAEEYEQVPSFEQRLTWLALRYAGVPRAPQIIHPEPDPTQANQSPSNKYKERLNTLLMVSVLVATVTFASGFTVPGGYYQDTAEKGMAILARRSAFQAFVICDTTALFSAVLAAVTLIWAQLDDLRLVLLSLDLALPLLGVSLAMMLVAFMSGLYVVLHTRLWLGVTVVVMGGVFLLVVLIFFIPLYSPTGHLRFKLFRYVFHVPFKLTLLACEKGKSRILY